ncbi:MAG: hypothetical protein H7Y01_06730 [Ferruginibacter sp.]|nr:hypothetical protein [Chitinophagaceae bacterium]
MEKYIEQLLSDIKEATENVSLPFAEKQIQLHDWVADEEEDKIAPVRQLEDWTGIRKEMLPPQEMLNDGQVNSLLVALIKMLDAYNWLFVLQTQVPERVQYAVIRDNFNQEAKVKRWHMGFFQFCQPGTEHKKCAFGDHCQCAFYEELFADCTDEELSPAEERARALEIEISHIKKKYGDDWMKYYPYHLDPEYDDDKGNPHNYGFEDDDEMDDNWWR